MNQGSEQIEEDITGITVSSGFGYNTQQPFVQMLILRADWMTQMSPANARELAINLLHAADAAESDGFLVRFLQSVVGVDDMSKVSGVLVQFREYREAQKGDNQ